MGLNPIGTPGRIRPLVSALIVAGLLIGHGLLVLRQFPLSSIRDGNLPVKGDVARYLATAEGVYRLGGTGYDPMAMAGYPVGKWNSVGKKGYELLGWLFPDTPLGIRFYAILVGLTITLPLVYWAVAWWLVRPVPAWLVLAVSLAFWHLDSQVAYFWSFGNVLYPGTSALVPLALALAWSVATGRRSALAAIGLGVVAGWIFYAHTVVEVALVAPIAGAAVWGAVTRKSIKPLIWLSVSVAIAVALAFPWMVALLQTRTDCVPQPQTWFQAGPKHLAADIVSDRGYARPYDRNFLLHFAVVAGCAGSVLSWRAGNRVVAFVGMGGLWCLMVTYTFSYFPGLRSFQPYRFQVPAVLCLAVPACVGIWEAWLIFSVSSLPARRLILLISIAFIPAGTAYLLDLSQPPMPCGLFPEERQLLDKVKNLPTTGRVLCELDTVGHLIPLWCGKPVIGGLNDQAFLKHRFAGMNDSGILFGRPLSSWTELDLRRYLNTYAVDYAVFSTPDWIGFAKEHPTLFTYVDRVGNSTIYRVVGEVGYVFEGKGSVTVGPDRLNVTAEEPFLVLKFHYSDLLKAPPGVYLEPIQVIPDDPVPFLGVRLTDSARSVGPFEIRCR